jgi:hypothetical protein
MKKYLYLFLITFCLGMAAKAAPGDTTWVQATVAQLGGYGAYDSTVAFPAPGKTYRNIYMIFTLGKYVCPGSPTYCGDWDYTVQNYLITRGGQTLELGRLITPYANSGAPRTSDSWLQHYVYDVTDYALVLRDTAKMRIFYSGYSGGFTANVKFAFVEGSPDREVLAIKRLWGGSYGYGGTPGINVHFPPKLDTAPAFTQSAELKFTVTGHGNDNTGCSEFCKHNYNVHLNGGVIDSYTIWRSDCGRNELFPQSGTWIYERGNWCPGSLVYSGHHKLPGVYEGVSSLIGIQFDPYIGNGGASYTTEGTLFYYGGMKKTLDASLEQIVAPTNDENHFRENPICGTPVVRVKNRGNTAITSLVFKYGLKDSLAQYYNWKGNLNTFEETEVVLPAMPQFSQISGATSNYTFTASIESVNAFADADPTNNALTSVFAPTPLWPSAFKIAFRPNNEAIATGSTKSETNWQIFDMNNNLVASRTDANISTLYTDTVSLPTGCYKLVVADGSCDGLHWWVFDQNPSIGVDAGYFYVRKLTATPQNIPINGYTYAGTYSHDFGCGFTQYFTTKTPITGVTNVADEQLEIAAYPNPAQDVVNVDIAGIPEIKGTIQIIDGLGRIVSVSPCTGTHQQISVDNFANGVYTILFINAASGNRLQARLLIAR